MSVELRSDASTVATVASTSLTVDCPAGVVAGDVLLAVVAAVGTPTITAPAGWVEVDTLDAGTSSLRSAVYCLVADGGEPASWSWTLDSSARAWVWVGAYTGVDPDDPIQAVAGEEDTTPGVNLMASTDLLRPEGRLVCAAAAVRSASGAAVAWSTPTAHRVLRASLSTNGGAGTDVAGCVVDGTGDAVTLSPDTRMVASLATTAGLTWAVALAPVLVPYDRHQLLRPIVEVAWGADPDGDPAGWTWTDISDQVTPAGVTITVGLAQDSRASMAPSASLSLTLLNADGAFTPDNPLSPYWPHVTTDVPIRVSMPYGYAPPTERITAFVQSWSPSWDATGDYSVVGVYARGRLERIQGATAPLSSALRRAISGLSVPAGALPVAYWPCEEEIGATEGGSALPGRPPLRVAGGVAFGAASDCAGSGPLPTLAEGGQLVGQVVGATPGAWCAMAVLRLPSTPVASTTTLMRVDCTGTARRWRVDLQPGTPDEMYVRAVDADGATVVENGFGIVESEIYGQWIVLALAATQDGSDVDYEVIYYSAVGSGTGGGGTASSRTCGAVTQVTVAATSTTAGMGAGHLAVWDDPTFDVGSDILSFAFAALTAAAGEWPSERFGRLCDELGVPHIVYDSSAISRVRMGPQPIAAAATALEECAATDQGLIHDAGPGGALAMVTRQYRYNQAPALILDLSAREVAAGLSPTLSTRDRVSDSIVTRAGGASGRYVDPTAPAGRQEQVTLSLAEDGLQAQIAAWRVAVSQAPGMRYPALPLDLRAAPQLAADWLAMRPGRLVRVTGLWAVPTHPPGPLLQHVDGWVERISSEAWTVTLHTYPAEPYRVGVRDDPDLGRRDTAGSELAADVDEDDTELLVATTLGPGWTQDPAHMPMNLDVDGEVVVVLEVSGSSSPQTMTVIRAANGVRKAHSAGTPVRVYQPARRAL